MRTADWHFMADQIRHQLLYGKISLGMHIQPNPKKNPRTITVDVMALADSRHGEPDSFGLPCVNHPELRDVNGLLVKADNRQYFLSAAFQNFSFMENRFLHVRPLDKLPPEIREHLLRTELEILRREPSMSQESLNDACDDLREEISELWGARFSQFEGYDRFAASWPAGVAWLHEWVTTNDFLELARIATFANRQAKYARDLGGSPRDLYGVKNTALNRLIAEWWHYTGAPESVIIDRDKDMISVTFGLSYQTFDGLDEMVHDQALHLPIDRLTAENRKKILSDGYFRTLFPELQQPNQTSR